MPETALPSEPYIRLGAFLGVFALMALWGLRDHFDIKRSALHPVH